MNLILRFGGFFNTNLRIWTSVVREELPCKQEASAVAVMKDHMVVGHLATKKAISNLLVFCEIAQSHVF